jgi:hypothetical protein
MAVISRGRLCRWGTCLALLLLLLLLLLRMLYQLLHGLLWLCVQGVPLIRLVQCCACAGQCPADLLQLQPLLELLLQLLQEQLLWPGQQCAGGGQVRGQAAHGPHGTDANSGDVVISSLFGAAASNISHTCGCCVLLGHSRGKHVTVCCCWKGSAGGLFQSSSPMTTLSHLLSAPCCRNRSNSSCNCCVVQSKQSSDVKASMLLWCVQP